jgi:hypothetical protein
MKMKFWCIRLLASFFVIGSVAIGALARVQFGLWVGLTLFFLSIGFGIYLHKAAEKINTTIRNQTNT